MVKRSPEDLCLLCKNSKADKKGSHYVPAGIIKMVIGERDYEELYTIDSAKTEVSTFFGRSNLENKDVTIKKPEHVDDYIFCSDCEKKLSIIEGLCNEKLNNVIDELKKGRLKIHKTSKGNKSIRVDKPSRNILILYFYSIIWRQCIQQQQLDKDTVFSEQFLEKLRSIVSSDIQKSIKEIEESEEYNSYPEMVIITSYHKSDTSNNFFMPNPTPTNPELFFVGIYDTLIYYTQEHSAEFEKKTGLSEEILDDELIINKSESSVIGIINEIQWSNKSKRVAENEAVKYLHNLTRKLAAVTGWPYFYARVELTSLANYFSHEFSDNYVHCLKLAYQKLTN